MREARGPEVMLQQAHHNQGELCTYIDHLEAVKEQCILCRLAGKENWQHSFTQCRQVHKWEYINAKRDVLRRTRRQWMRKYDACFRCYQPQALCTRPEGGKCQYTYLAMQAVFGAYQSEHISQAMSREFEVQFTEVEEALIWAGKTAELGDMVCVQGVLVLHWILKRLAAGLE